jgi:TonB-linked SusC/RagA family outer membrane protein
MKKLFYSLSSTSIFILTFSFLLISASSLAQNVVSGRVFSEEDKELLPGVGIVIKGTNIGAASDIDGFFKITVPDSISLNKITLVFSFVGYATGEEKLEGRNYIEFSLKARGCILDEVIVTALAIQKLKGELGYSTQQISPSDFIENRDANLLNSLSGRIAGVNILGGNSGVGSSSRVVIRGEISMNRDNQPLFVVDGVPISNNINTNENFGNLTVDFGNGAGMLNPEDFESVTVLKGANASALYGSRAANGVIILKSKKGRRNNKRVSVEYSNTTVFDKALKFWDFQNKYGQGQFQLLPFSFENGAGAGEYDDLDESWGPEMDGRLIPQFDSPTENGFRGGDTQVTDRGNIIATPWLSHPENIESLYRTGTTITQHLALSGGDAQWNTRWRVSYTRMDNKGILPNTDLKRNSITLNFDKNLNEKLTLETNLQYHQNESDNRPTAGYNSESIQYLWVWLPRQVNLNSLKEYWQKGQEDRQQFNFMYKYHDNPFFSLNENTNAFEQNRLLGNISLNYEFNSKLNLKIRSGIDQYDEFRTFKRAFSTNRHPLGQYREANLNFREHNTDFLFTYVQNYDAYSDWHFQVSFGGNRMSREAREMDASANGLLVPNVYSLTNNIAPVNFTSSSSNRAIYSLYGIGEINYKNLAYLTITGRNDWSNSLSKGNRSYFYPSTSLSLKMSDIFKINTSTFYWETMRMSWAQVGNDATAPTSDFVQLPLLGKVPRATERSVITSNLKPEKTDSYEIGTSLGFFSSRVNLDVTYYTIQNRRQVINVPISSSTGYESKLMNIGEVKSKGWELSLNLLLYESTSGLRWNSRINWSTNRTSIVKLAESEGISTYLMSSQHDVYFLAKTGERMGDIYGAGHKRTPDGQVIHDQAGEPLFDTQLKKIGNYNPQWWGGWENTFNFKNFSLGVLIDGRYGGKIYSRVSAVGTASGVLASTLEGREEGRISEGVIEMPDGTYKPNDVVLYAPVYYWVRSRREIIAEHVFDASFWKLRELKFGYTLNKYQWKKLPFESVSLWLIGRNLYLRSKTPNIDPEAYSFTGNRMQAGIENMSMPSVRSLGFVLNVKI